jgi:hypothetical protein
VSGFTILRGEGWRHRNRDQAVVTPCRSARRRQSQTQPPERPEPSQIPACSAVCPSASSLSFLPGGDVQRFGDVVDRRLLELAHVLTMLTVSGGNLL